MDNTNMNVKLTNNYGLNKLDKFTDKINLDDLGLILKQATAEIENGIKGKDAYKALDEIEIEVFGELLRNRS